MDKANDYMLVLLQYEFFVGEIEEEADIMLTFISIVLSIVVIFSGSWFCYQALVKPQYKSFKARLTKQE